MHDSQLADVVEQVYEAALNETPWSDVLCSVADLCGAENAALVVADSRLGYSSVVAPRADPEVVLAYADMWWLHDPTSKATASAPVGQVTTLADTGRDLFLRSPFHNEFWQRSGLGNERIATNLIVGDGLFSSLVLQMAARRDEIDEAMFERFSFLVPHFVRAVNLARRLYRIEMEEIVDGYLSDKGYAGIIVVDDAARIIFADAAAEALLVPGDYLQTTSGILRLAQHDAEMRLCAAITACATGRPQLALSRQIQIARGTDAPPLLMEVLPYRGGIAKKVAVAASYPAPVALLVLHDPEKVRDTRLAAFKIHYGLTPAEAKLAVEMLAGDGRAAAAARCGISVNTARTHLMRVFEKTGVSRQAELIRLLLDSRCQPDG